jgi:hypothetical protein
LEADADKLQDIGREGSTDSSRAGLRSQLLGSQGLSRARTTARDAAVQRGTDAYKER